MSSRKEFIIGSTVLVAKALTGCAPPRVAEKSPPKSIERISLAEITPPLSKRELRELVASLPDNEYKEFVSSALPLFQEPTPSLMQLAGLPINVHDVRVETRVVERGQPIGGRISMAKRERSPRFRLSQDVSFVLTLPYLGYTNDEVQINYPGGAEFSEGLEPVISFVIPEGGYIRKEETERYLATRRFTLLKEVFTLAYGVAYMEKIIKRMQEFNLPLHIAQREAISQSFIELHNQGGRLEGIIDIAPYFLVKKAVISQQRFLDPRNTSPDVEQQILVTDFGRKDEMVEKTIAFILAHKDEVKNITGRLANLDKRP